MFERAVQPGTRGAEPMKQRGRPALSAGLTLGFLLAGCSEIGESGSELSAAAAEGRGIYLSSCIACHNADPNLPGSLGPEIAGSARALLEARVLRGAYPPGYTPKRSTRAMVPLPHLADKIDALAAYLAEAASEGDRAPLASSGPS